MPDTPQNEITETPQGVADPASSNGTPEGETLLAGKYKTQEELVSGYEALEQKLGDWEKTEEYAKLGQAVNEIGTDVVEDFINRRDEFEAWRQNQAGAHAPGTETPAASIDPNEFWKKATNDPLGEIGTLMDPVMDAKIDKRMQEIEAKLQGVQQKNIEDLTWTNMRHRDGFQDNEKEFQDWYKKQSASIPGLYDLFLESRAGKTALESARQAKVDGRRFAASIAGDPTEAPSQIKLDPPKTFEEARANADKLRAAGVRYNL